tara:strand:+ start:116217 stop:117101 length:885 start_codon:yes stop_codon:yes gene_type:complete
VSKSLYLCTNCRKQIEQAHKVLFVDQSRNNGFCSEDCIVEYLTPMMESFENEEIVNRETVGINFSEGFEDLFQDQAIFHQVLYNPDKIFKFKNQIGNEFYTHFFELAEHKATYIIITTYYNNEPSFVYFKTITRSKELINVYSVGEAIDSVVSESLPEEIEAELEDNISLPKELMEDIEMKKSEYLAKLLEARDEADVPFEKFPDYDEYLPLVLEEPDEIYEQEDESGDDIKVYIKSFKSNKLTFFYIVLCIEIEIKELENQNALMPILGFPSQDTNLYKEYAIGNRITEMTKN